MELSSRPPTMGAGGEDATSPTVNLIHIIHQEPNIKAKNRTAAVQDSNLAENGTEDENDDNESTDDENDTDSGDDLDESQNEPPDPIANGETTLSHAKSRFERVKLAKKYQKERWLVRDSQPNPGDIIKRIGALNELRRVPINIDNLKNKDKTKEEDPGNGIKLITAITVLPGFDTENEGTSLVRHDSYKDELETGKGDVRDGEGESAGVDPIEMNLVVEETINEPKEPTERVNPPTRIRSDSKGEIKRADVEHAIRPTGRNFESAIEKCMSYVKETLIHEHDNLRDKIYHLEKETFVLGEENSLLKSLLTQEQTAEFERKILEARRTTIDPRCRDVDYRAQGQPHPQQQNPHQMNMSQHAQAISDSIYSPYTAPRDTTSNLPREVPREIMATQQRQMTQSTTGHDGIYGGLSSYHHRNIYSSNNADTSGRDLQSSMPDQRHHSVQRPGVPNMPTYVSHSSQLQPLAMISQPNLQAHHHPQFIQPYQQQQPQQQTSNQQYYPTSYSLKK